MDYGLDDAMAEAAAARGPRPNRHPPRGTPPEQNEKLHLVKVWLCQKELDELRQLAHERGYGVSHLAKRFVKSALNWAIRKDRDNDGATAATMDDL